MLGILPFVIGPLASLLLRITAIQTNLVAAMHPRLFMKDQRMNIERACMRKDARKYAGK